MMKLSNTKLYMNSIKLLVISTVLATVVISIQSCDEQETSPAYAKHIVKWVKENKMLDIILVTLTLIVNGFLFTIWGKDSFVDILVKFSLFIIVVLSVTKIIVDFGAVL